MSGACRIALLQEHSLLRTALAEWFRTFGDGVRVVASGAAVDEIRSDPSYPVDLVVLDVDGESVASDRVREFTLDGVACLVLVLSVDPAALRAALDAGARGCVIATAGPEALETAVHRTLAGERYLSPEIALALGE